MPLSVLTMPESVPYFQIIDEAGHPVHEADLFLRDTCARLGLLTTQRSYAFALLDWLQFLHGRRRKVNEVSRQDVVDYLLELRTKANPQRARRSAAAPRPGSINAVTGKSTLRPGYAPATIKQRLTVVGLFYDVLESAALGPPQHPLGRIKPGVIASDPKSYHSDYSSKRVTGSRKSAPVRCFCDENPWEPTPPRYLADCPAVCLSS
ncbi:hypothetical protein [Deinococcus sp. NW-56]|uniref:hypothetical protein n=1 Tax=Deinococcus sp. NW-56 TaxID=2080419 RepID=UPI001319FC64|nr:hypothetical protein [Deinococcus sp. NW-56]